MRFLLHHMQLDDFNHEDYWILGPSSSGLNSRAESFADEEQGRSVPLLSMRVDGPSDPQVPIVDNDIGALTLGNVELLLRPLDLRADVPRLVAIALRLRNWVPGTDQTPSDRAAAAFLSRMWKPGFDAPRRGGQTIFYVSQLKAPQVLLTADLKLKHRGITADDDDLDTQLRKIAAKVSPAVRSVIGFLARMGALFVEVSPRFNFSPLTLSNSAANVGGVISSLVRHYQQQLLAQSARVIGSLQVLGDPARLIDDIGGGVATLLSTPKDGSGDGAAGPGSKNVGHLVGIVVAGGFRSASKITGSLKDTVGSCAGRPFGDDRKATDFADGIDMGISSLAMGVSEAVIGLVKEPAAQAAAGGACGLLKGSCQGACGLIAKPIEGLLGAMEKVSQGAEGEIRGLYRGYTGLRRPARIPFDEKRGEEGVQALPRGLFWPEFGFKVQSVKMPWLWRERRVISLVINLGQSHPQGLNQVKIGRAAGPDQWCAQARSSTDDGSVGLGRVGQLKGPFHLQVYALLEGNLQMTLPFKVLAASGELPTELLVESLVTLRPTFMTFSVKAQGRLANGGAGLRLREEPPLGEVAITLWPHLNGQILPERFVPDTTFEHGLQSYGLTSSASHRG